MTHPGTDPARARDLPPMGHYARAAAVVVGVVALALLAWATRGVLLMIFGGFLLAAGLDPLVRSLERRGLRRGWAVFFVVLAILAVVIAFVIVALRPAIAQAAEFVLAIPDLLEQLSVRFGGSDFATYLASPEFAAQVRSAIDNIVEFAAQGVSVVVGVLSGIAGIVFTAFTIGAITVYLMLALPRIKSFAGRALGEEERVGVFSEALNRIGGYVTGQLGICACAGIAAGIVFVILDMPYAALLALVVAVLDAVPQVGATIGAIIASVVALTVSIGTMVAVIVFFVIYQQIENYVIVPRVFAYAVSLTPITVFLAVLLGGTVGGFVGAIVALPVAASLKVIVQYVFRSRLAQIESREVPASLAPTQPRARSRERPVDEPERNDGPEA
ncbi:MAG TPA: AI-2E family transporter [Jiangellaceae bacterium]|nr:AI-2E family transporter [Jiangellaceae bacterium]